MISIIQNSLLSAVASHEIGGKLVKWGATHIANKIFSSDNGTNLTKFPLRANLPAWEAKSLTKESPWAFHFRHVHQNKELLLDPHNGWLENLTKVQIKDGLEIGDILPCEGGEYRVHRKISQEGLVAYALTPLKEESSLPPLIAFRCTMADPFKEEGLNSVCNDLDPCIGQRGYFACQSKFADLMNDPTFRGKDQKIQVTGYSLGGAQAQYFVKDHFRNVSHAIFYNDPSITEEAAEDFASEINQMHLKDPLIIQIFRTEGDPCHLFGGKHLGWGVDHPQVMVQLLEIEHPNQPLFDVELHSKRIFHTNAFDYIVTESTDPKMLDKKLNNLKRSAFSCLFETIRRELSGFLASFFNSIFNFFKKKKESS